MTGVELFHFDEEPIRVLTIDGEPRFVVTDLARVLGYRDANTAARLLKDHQQGYAEVRTPGGTQRMVVCTESGFNRLVMRSNASRAEQVQDWVEADVLPQIRKTGGYGRQVDISAITRSDLARMVLESETAREAAEAERDALRPSADAWDHLASTAHGDFSLNEAAKTLCRDDKVVVGERRLFTLLESWGWIYRDPAGDWRPYQAQVDSGRLATRARSHHHPRTGELVMDAPQVRVTAKGVEAIYRRLSAVVV